ncbi:hypothetical protein C8F04DRAFT_1102134 [Mycena alexandri]|uniref:Uncharacterized protein n=1 Tax=Mycena alexandri TaxID=1745969 RepID=A0AAD6X488_9AGAR|nr:hypothetical protein C8F04DRAFT_1102134 [Mycena alexandri]
MLALSPPSMWRSVPKKRCTKPAQPMHSDFVSADPSPNEETDLRRFALKRHSLEKALAFDSTSDHSDYSFLDSDLSVCKIDYTAVATIQTPSSPPVSQCSLPSRPGLKRTASTVLPPTSTAALSTSPSKRPTFERTASIFDFPNTLVQLQFRGSCSSRLGRALVDSVSSAGSRRSSIDSTSSSNSADSASSRDSKDSDSNSASITKPRLSRHPARFRFCQ